MRVNFSIRVQFLQLITSGLLRRATAKQERYDKRRFKNKSTIYNINFVLLCVAIFSKSPWPNYKSAIRRTFERIQEEISIIIIIIGVLDARIRVNPNPSKTNKYIGGA